MNDFIYLDNSATTRICDEALRKYNDVSLSCFGNPSSLHGKGVDAEGEINAARKIILDSINAANCNLFFTSSGTEANNLAILGRAFAKERFKNGAKIITTQGEHASVNQPLEALKKLGYKIAYISTRGGAIDLDELANELTSDTILVSVMMVNNETGAVYNIPAIKRTMISKGSTALLHVDATQGFMKIPFTKSAIGADMITLSAHKIEGPKGVGALVVDSSVIKSRELSAITLGGGQESGYRSGTENVPGICAFGEAVRVYSESLSERITHIAGLRDYLVSELTDKIPEISTTNPEYHAPHILNITLPSIKSETTLHYLSSLGIYVSSGSACSSNSRHRESALVAYGRSEREADCSIRISTSHRNTKEDIDALVSALREAVNRLARMR